MSSRFVHPSRLFLASLLASLILHGFVAAGFIWLRFPQTSQTSQTPTVHLEIAQVVPSYSETPDENAPAAAASVAVPSVKPPDLPRAEPIEIDRKSVEQWKGDNTIVQPPTFNLQPYSAPRQATVDAPPKPRQNIRPDYPRSSRLHGEEGDVALEISVTASGAVEDVRVIRSSGFSALDKAAVEAVRAAQFSPATSDGRAVASSARLTLRFRLK